MCMGANAQICGFDKAHRGLMSNSSSPYAQHVQQMDSDLAAYMSANASALIVNGPNGPVYDIPVVIHVLHTGGILGSNYNPTDAQLQGMITYLNTTYAASTNTYSYPVAGSGGTYFPVQFTLAKRDLNCNSSSTGINRVNAVSMLSAIYGATVANNYSNYGVRFSGTQGVGEDTLKALSIWNNHDYYNIWIMNKIDGVDGYSASASFVAGYAYFPGAPASLDGTIMLASQATAGKITLPHEIGHAFSLYHVFEGDDPGGTGAATTCPSNANCAVDGDKVCDTEPMKRSGPSNCPTINSCTGLAFTNNTQRNFMNYSSCQDRFTPGQQVRWLNSLNTARASLITSLGATTLGTVPTAYNCAPTISFPFNAYDAGPRDVTVSTTSGTLLMAGTSEGGYNSDGNQVYIDRSCFQRANVTAGQTYTFSVKTGINPEKVRIYIDYNNDGTFASSELVYTHTGTASYETHTTSIAIPTTAGVITCAPIRMRVISDLSTSAMPTPCIALDAGQAEDFSMYIKPAAASTVSVSLTSGSNPSCANTSLGFTGNYTGSPTTPAVHIYVNGVLKSLTNTYTSTTFNNGDVVTAMLIYGSACGGLDSISSAGYTVTRATVVTPSVTEAITTGTNPGCAGQSITLTATPTNGGTAPTYQWFVNGLAATGASGANATYTFTPACGDNIQVKLNSNSNCASTPSVTSNIITYTCGPQAISVNNAITAGSNPTCSGRSVTFAATPTNGGTAPTYQWYVNGSPVTGATAASFTTTTLNNGDSVTVKLTSSSPCAATPFIFSPAIYMIVVPSVTPGVKLSVTAGTNPGCISDALQLTGVTANAGATPTYRWFVNGTLIPAISGGTANPYTLPTGGNTGDKYWVRIIGANPGASCYTRDTAYSDTITLDRRPVPSLPAISYIGRQLMSDSANVQWYGPAGLLPGATGPTYIPTVQGDYYALIPSPLCGTGKSNVLTISPLTVGNYNMKGVSLYPNPTTGLLTITWSAPANTRITVYSTTGKALLYDAATGARKALDLSALPSGIYFVQLQDEAGNSGVMRVTLAH